MYFILINIVLYAICLVRPKHRNNVYRASMLYGSMHKFLGLDVDIRVPDSVKNGGPFIYICNHQNSYDLLTISGAVQPGTVTIGKKSLVWVPIFGLLYWLSGNILIDRKNAKQASGTLEQSAKKIVQSKLSIWMFPEGTRSYGRGILPFKTGAFRLAQLANVPVVLITASNLHNKVALGRWNNGKMIVKMSDPVYIDDSKDIRAWADEFHRNMKQEFDELNQLTERVA